MIRYRQRAGLCEQLTWIEDSDKNQTRTSYWYVVLRAVVPLHLYLGTEIMRLRHRYPSLSGWISKECRIYGQQAKSGLEWSERDKTGRATYREDLEENLNQDQLLGSGLFSHPVSSVSGMPRLYVSF